MAIELRILSGARAGERQTFDQPVVTVGRQQQSDLRFDAQRDLDVSARHAELRESGGSWTVVDQESTNGTFVNQTRVTGPVRLQVGDVVAFGKKGPTVEVGVGTSGAKAVASPPRRPTGERVAIEVKAQTRSLRLVLGIVVVVLTCVAVGSVWVSRRQSAAQLGELTRLLAQNDSATAKILAQAGSRADTSFTNALQRQNDSLRSHVQASSAGSAAQIEALRAELEQRHATQQGLAGTDFSSIHERNNGAVALLISEIGGQRFGGTAFCVTPGGLLVTNRHNVRDPGGAEASRVTIQFANTSRRLSAHVVAISSDTSVDLALIQVDDPGHYPTVSGISRVGATQVGAPVVTIGFPESIDLPMAGDTMSASLIIGTVGRRLPNLLQIDSYASHGSSGTPVFGTDGFIVGVIFGGEKGSNGRIVYAVPSDKLVDFLPATARGILR